MQYKVVCVRMEGIYDTEKMEKEVNDLLEQGWKLQGGIAVSTHPFTRFSNVIYGFQAMIKEDNNN